MGNATEKTHIAQKLAVDRGQLLQQGMLRKERLVAQRDGVRVKIDGRWLINFCSNDYLELASHPEIIKAMQQAAAYGVGSTASPLVCGKTVLQDELEHKLARMLGRERALILSSGYAANLALQSALVSSRKQPVILDRLCHASTVDAAVLARSQLKRYRHADPEALERILRTSLQKPALVFTESVFSMDGDIAPLGDIAAACSRHEACLVVDDAHGFGVIGAQGLGGMDHFALNQHDVPLLMATFGKAAGVYGAFVAGPDELIETLVQRARPYIYSTALPAAIIAAAGTALDVMQSEPWRREKLHSLIKRFRAGAASIGAKVLESATPIQPLIVGRPDTALACSQLLEQEGIFVSAIRPPTVPQNSSRLRITLTAAHSEEQVDGLVHALHKSLSKSGLVR